MIAAAHRGPHPPERSSDAIPALKKEAKEKFANNQCIIISWEEVKDNLPSQLNISPATAIPRNICKLISIINLSFKLMINWFEMPLVNEAKIHTVKKEAIEQLGKLLLRSIAATPEVPEDDNQFSSAK